MHDGIYFAWTLSGHHPSTVYYDGGGDILALTRAHAHIDGTSIREACRRIHN